MSVFDSKSLGTSDRLRCRLLKKEGQSHVGLCYSPAAKNRTTFDSELQSQAWCPRNNKEGQNSAPSVEKVSTITDDYSTGQTPPPDLS